MQSLITRENLSPESPWLPTRTRRTTPHGAWQPHHIYEPLQDIAPTNQDTSKKRG
jgi:hypothetical protein